MILYLICSITHALVHRTPMRILHRDSSISASRSPSRTGSSLSMQVEGYRPAWWKTALASVGILTTTITFPQVDAVKAADTVKVGKCLLQSCQKELAQCILNPSCLANVICLNSCNGRSDEAECQIKCGDTFENDVVGTFNKCAVSQKKCVPQKQDEGLYPVPPLSAQVKKFDTKIWDGKWYITAGLNKIFDTFDCQVHFFTSPYPGKFYAKLFWRIDEPDGEFFTKNAVQRFIQDPKNPAHMINHDNEYLHYKDDWYILDYEPDKFVLVYYQGSNDAWDGYGGAFLYTREPTLDPELVPRLEAAVDRMENRYKWKDFTLTDNSCQLQKDSALALRERFVEKALVSEEEQLVAQLTALRGAAVNTFVADEKKAERSISKLEKQVENYEKGLLNELGKDVEAVEKVIEDDEKAISKFLGFGKK